MDQPKSIMAMADLATPMSIRVAATLSLAERAGSQGATAHQLASETGTSALALRCMLDHLVAVGVFDVDAATGRYKPTPLGDQMREDAPAGIKRFLDMNSAGGRADLAFVELRETITTGASAYVHRYGQEFWADIDAQPELRRSFDAQMTWRYQAQAPQIAERFDWRRFPEIVDVGGGDGNLLTMILNAHPGVRGKVVDLPPSAAAAAERFTEAGLTDRASAIPGSFFDPLPTGADAYVLSDIVHNWDDEHVRKILSGCRQAAAPSGTVVVIEAILDQGTNSAINLFMLMCFGGRERSIDEIAELAADSGLKLRDSMPVSDGRTALEFAVA